VLRGAGAISYPIRTLVSLASELAETRVCTEREVARWPARAFGHLRFEVVCAFMSVSLLFVTVGYYRHMRLRRRLAAKARNLVLIPADNQFVPRVIWPG
jgi:hypothetical protein